MLKLFFIAVALLGSGAAHAATCPTVITAPCTVESSGDYVLGANLDITNVTPDPTLGLQIGIKIAEAVGNVDIHCDIFSIRHNGNYDSNGVGIYGGRVANVGINNCNIFGQGMAYGIVINNTADPAYQTILVRNNVVSSRLIGIQVISKAATVEDNLLRIMGRVDDSLAFPGGISVKSLTGSAIVKRNRVWQIENSFSDEVFGIQVANSYGSVVEDNSIENPVKSADSWAFWINNGTYTFNRNRIVNFDYGFGLVVGSSGTIDNTEFEGVENENFYIPSSMPDLSTWTISNPSPP